MTQPSPTQPSPTQQSGRLAGIDAARAFALFGMALTHLNLTVGADDRATVVGTVAAGRASALFAVLAGVGVSLATASMRSRLDHTAAVAGLLVRALIIGTLGLALVTLLGDPPAVILAQYALLFVVATTLLSWGPRRLLVAAAVWCVVSPVLSHLLRAGMPDGPGAQPDLRMATMPGELLVTLGLTGYYPVLTWITYLLVGMGVGRLDLRSARTAWHLVGTGLVLALAATTASALLVGTVGAPPGVSDVELLVQRAGITPAGNWRWLLTDARHSGTAFDLAHTTGSALVVIGGFLLLARAAPAGGVATVSSRAVSLLAATGAASLTLYTLHILVAGALGPFGPVAWAVQVAVALLIGSVLRVSGRRGPLESLVGSVTRRLRLRIAAGPQG